MSSYYTLVVFVCPFTCRRTIVCILGKKLGHYGEVSALGDQAKEMSGQVGSISTDLKHMVRRWK